MSRHNDLIAEQQRMEPAWQRRGFRKAAMALLRKVDAAEEEDLRMPDDIEELHRDLSFVPDLFYVTDNPPTIAICEVECAHRVPADKRACIAVLADFVAGMGVGVRILIVDAHGGRTEVQWEDWHMEWIARNARELYPDAPALQEPAEPPREKRQPGRKARPTRTLDEIIEASIARRQKRRDPAR
jgi:hypothetical protein